MTPNRWFRWLAVGAAVACCVLLGSCDGNSGVGFSVGLPASYGNMELGLTTADWVGAPTW